MSKQHVHFEVPERNCYVMLSEEPVDTAVVFVHGWGGDNFATWEQFQTLVDQFGEELRWWQSSDIYFYSYDSVDVGVRPNALEFGTFLSDVFPQPASWTYCQRADTRLAALGINGEVLFREQPPTYSKLILVAHSAGATVVRHWILELANRLDAELIGGLGAERLQRRIEAATADATSVEELRIRGRSIAAAVLAKSEYACLTARLCLFAPAHCGASITGSYGALLAFSGRVGTAIVKYSTMAGDLQPTSPLITSLRRKTEELASRFEWVDALRAYILWGKDDKVVYMDKFDRDVDRFLSDQSHTSICKPTSNYLEPLKFVTYDKRTTSSPV